MLLQPCRGLEQFPERLRKAVVIAEGSIRVGVRLHVPAADERLLYLFQVHLPFPWRVIDAAGYQRA